MINGTIHVLIVSSISENIRSFIYGLICCSERSTLHFFPIVFPSSSSSIIYGQGSVWSQQSAPSSLPQIRMWQKRTVGALIMWTGIWIGPGNTVQLTKAWLIMKAIGWQSGVRDTRCQRKHHARVWVAPCPKHWLRADTSYEENARVFEPKVFGHICWVSKFEILVSNRIQISWLIFKSFKHSIIKCNTWRFSYQSVENIFYPCNPVEDEIPFRVLFLSRFLPHFMLESCISSSL